MCFLYISNKKHCISSLKMNFFKKLFSPNKNYEKANIKWSDLIKKVYESIAEKDEIKYPVILFCHVIWDFEVYKNPTEIIEQSISGHWGLFPEPFDPEEIIIDSNGKVFKLSKNLYDENTKTGFSYPVIYDRSESIDFLKDKIFEGCTSYISDWETQDKIEIENTLEVISEMNTFSEIIEYVNISLTDLK